MSVSSFAAPTRYMSLVEKYPEVAAEFHPTRNVGIDVQSITYASNKRVLWRCAKGCSTSGCTTPIHEWISSVNNRTLGRGCPYCAHGGSKVCGCKTLAFRYPHIAVEWHPTMNPIVLRPETISYGSEKPVYWLCQRGCSTPGCTTPAHVWKATPNTRTSNSSGCPYCARKQHWVCVVVRRSPSSSRTSYANGIPQRMASFVRTLCRGHQINRSPGSVKRDVARTDVCIHIHGRRAYPTGRA